MVKSKRRLVYWKLLSWWGLGEWRRQLFPFMTKYRPSEDCFRWMVFVSYSILDPLPACLNLPPLNTFSLLPTPPLPHKPPTFDEFLIAACRAQCCELVICLMIIIASDNASLFSSTRALMAVLMACLSSPHSMACFSTSSSGSFCSRGCRGGSLWWPWWWFSSASGVEGKGRLVSAFARSFGQMVFSFGRQLKSLEMSGWQNSNRAPELSLVRVTKFRGWLWW